MPRDYRQQLDDILMAVDRIRSYVKGMSYEGFLADFKTQDAVIRNLEVIGEAARSLPEEVRERTITVDWGKLSGFRNILIHEYFGVSLPIVWNVIDTKLGELEDACKQILEGAS